MWLAGTKGVFRQEKERFAEIPSTSSHPLAGVVCLKGDADGAVWMGTLADGLIRWRDGKMDRIDVNCGLPDREVHGIMEDSQGRFWMPLNRGILRASRKQLNAVADGSESRLEFQLLEHNEGLPSIEFALGQPNCARDPAGRIYLATLKGVTVVDPARFRLNSCPPPVQIEQLRYHPAKGPSREGGRQAYFHTGEVHLSAPFAQPLRLPPGSYGLDFECAALSYSAPEKVRFEYQLEGMRQDWEEAGTLPVVTFHRLPPGQYVFRVRAANNDGVWNPTGASLAFTMLPFFWQTGWFRVIVALLLMGGGGGVVWSRVRARLRRGLELELLAIKLRESEERLNLAAESAGAGLWNWDFKTNLIWVTERTRKLYGFSPAELIPLEDFLSKLHPEDRDWVAQAGQKCAQEGADFHYDHRVVLPDGTFRWLKVQAKVVLTPMGKPERMTGVSLDVTERQRAELELQQHREELAHLSRVTMLGELSGSLAHELNQPLTAILSNAQAAQRFLARDAPDLAELREILTDIVAEDKRAGEVIRRLRLLLKKSEFHHQPLDVNAVVREVLKLVRNDLVNRGVFTQVDLASDLPAIGGDRVQLQQVIINLVMNACHAMTDATPADRLIVLRTIASAGEGVRVEVADRGCGIPPKNLERIFEPFFTTRSEGMGLGLAVCRTIISAHGGKMGARNNAERGALFYFTIQAQAEPQP